MEEKNPQQEFLLDLIKLESESGNEIEIGNFIINRLKDKFKIQKQMVNSQKGNFNILAYTGNPKVILVAHLDTVKKQLPIVVKEDFIYGRGACDNKSQVASIILACEKCLKEHISDFGMLFTVEEETDFSGAKKAIEIIPRNVEIIFVGEPTGLDLLKGHKGLITFKLIAKGKSAHSALPEKGLSAIDLLIEDLNKIKSIDFVEDSNLGKTTLNIGLISGGTGSNVVPASAEAIISLRTVKDSDKILNQIKENIKNCELELFFSYNPIFFEIPPVLKEMQLKTRVAPYFTEAYFFKDIAPVFIIGAGNEEDAHSDNEKVEVQQFFNLIKLYSKILKNYLLPVKAK